MAQCPDSESIAGVLESLTRLHAQTGEERWLEAAKRAAALAASWVVSYDVQFPAESTFGKMHMHAAGTVLANAQNKHSAPGICTHSGQSLLRLYRATGKPFYMDLCRDIAHALPQFLSRKDRLIEFNIHYNKPLNPNTRHLEPGWMCERVNLTQWGPTELPGEVFYYSCWSEVALLLTCAELPGIYADRNSGRIWCFDHVEAEWTDTARKELRITNPTKFAASVRVAVETDLVPTRSSLPWDYVANLPSVEIPPRDSLLYLSPSTTTR